MPLRPARHGLRLGELVDALGAAFAAEAGLLHAARWLFGGGAILFERRLEPGQPLACRLDQLDVFFEQFVDQLVDGDAPRFGPR